jgi:hypothetical protein
MPSVRGSVRVYIRAHRSPQDSSSHHSQVRSLLHHAPRIHLNFFMDPLSISASILGIIGAVQTVRTELKPYYKAWTEYHKENEEFDSELKSLGELLENASASVVKLGEQDKENPSTQSQAFAAGVHS